jgi:hypothetical protein
MLRGRTLFLALVMISLAACASVSHAATPPVAASRDSIGITIVNRTAEELRVTLMNGAEPLGATVTVQPMATIRIRRPPHELTVVYAIVRIPGARARTRETERMPVADGLVLEIDDVAVRWRITPPQ